MLDGTIVFRDEDGGLGSGRNRDASVGRILAEASLKSKVLEETKREEITRGKG